MMLKMLNSGCALLFRHNFFFVSLGFHLSEDEKDGKNFERKVGEHDLKKIKLIRNTWCLNFEFELF